MPKRSRPARPSAWPIAGGRITVGLVIGRLTEGPLQRQVVALARGLDPRRHQVRIYCLSAQDHPYGPALAGDGFPVVTLPAGRAAEPRRVVRLARALRQDGVDVVHGFGWSGAAYAAVAARLARIVTVVASLGRTGAGRPGARGYVRAGAIRGASIVLAASHADAESVRHGLGIAPGRLKIVPDGVALSRFPAPGRLDGLRDRVRGGPPVVAAVAGWRSSADRALFTAAADRVVSARPDVQFICLVSEDDVAAVAALAPAGAAAPAVVTDRDRRARELGRSAVLWAIGAEPLALTCMLEAMAAARPVVATRHPDSERIVVDGGTGLLVGADDASALADRTVTLLETGSRRRELGYAARARAERCFSTVEMTAAVAGIYQQALLGLLGTDEPADAADAMLASPASVKER